MVKVSRWWTVRTHVGHRVGADAVLGVDDVVRVVPAGEGERGAEHGRSTGAIRAPTVSAPSDGRGTAPAARPTAGSTGRKKPPSPPRPSVQTCTSAPRRGQRLGQREGVHHPAARLGRVGEQRDPHRAALTRRARSGRRTAGARPGGAATRRARATSAADVDLGDGEPGLGPGPGEHVAARADDLGLAEEAQPADGAGLVGRDPRRPGSPPPGRSRTGRTAGTAGPACSRGARSVTLAGQADRHGEDLGAVQGQGRARPRGTSCRSR